MQKRKSNYLSDDFVVSDDEVENGSSAAPATKRSKAQSSSQSNSNQAQEDADGNTFWEISKSRRVVISEFKGKKMVSIREYYQKDGKDLPGKKGITMTIEQYSTLMGLIPPIEVSLSDMGHSSAK